LCVPQKNKCIAKLLTDKNISYLPKQLITF